MVERASEAPGQQAPVPEIGQRVQLGGLTVNYHDHGEGRPVLLIHGSGPGVSAWANWRPVFGQLEGSYRLIAPDMVGFGYTDAPRVEFDLDVWVGQLTGLLDHLGLEHVAVIGNSFGGSMAVHLAERHPERVDRMVLMGPSAASFAITPGLEDVWGYTPSLENMAHLLRDVFVYDAASIGDDLIEMRYRASMRHTVQERFAALFPAPRQRWLDRLGLPAERLAAISAPALFVHGRDDKVVPLVASRTAAAAMPNARVAVIDQCGHWVQIEHTDEFCELVADFLAEGK